MGFYYLQSSSKDYQKIENEDKKDEELQHLATEDENHMENGQDYGEVDFSQEKDTILKTCRPSPSSTIKFHRIQNRELAIDG